MVVIWDYLVNLVFSLVIKTLSSEYFFILNLNSNVQNSISFKFRLSLIPIWFIVFSLVQFISSLMMSNIPSVHFHSSSHYIFFTLPYVFDNHFIIHVSKTEYCKFIFRKYYSPFCWKNIFALSKFTTIYLYIFQQSQISKISCYC